MLCYLAMKKPLRCTCTGEAMIVPKLFSVQAFPARFSENLGGCLGAGCRVAGSRCRDEMR
jgi:hypothetical protein